MIGKRVGPWLIVEEIGDGGHAFVFKGLRGEESVAVKMLKRSAGADESLEKRFEIEAEALRTLDHPHIVGFRDYIRENEYHYLILEFMDAGSADHVLRLLGPLEAKYAVPIFNQVLKGVAHAHSYSYIHRDIKPNNILLNRKGEAKLTDFGIARVVGGGHALTKKGFVLGTSAYMAPEYLTEGRATEQLDVYALGVTFYELLTARKPFEFERDDEPLKSFAQRVLKGVPTPPSAYVPIDPALERILMTAIAREERRRYKTAEKFRADLCAAFPDLVDRPILINKDRIQTNLHAVIKLEAAPSAKPAGGPSWISALFARLFGRKASTAAAPAKAPAAPLRPAPPVEPEVHADPVADAAVGFGEHHDNRPVEMTEESELDAYLNATSGPDKGKRFGLRPVSRIGRDLRFDIRPRDPEMSRQHAMILFDGAGFMLKDMGSANGTFVNERRVTADTKLKNGDIVRVGRTSLRFEELRPA